MKFDNYKMGRLQALLNFLDKSVYKTIAAQEVEQVAFYSYRNFNRIFKLFLNKSIGQYHKEKKLAEGARQLVYYDKSASEVAFDLGYNDLQAFNKAFKKVYGISPALFKENMQGQFEMDFYKKIEEKKAVIEKMNFQQVDLKPFKAITLTHYGSYKSAGILDVWERLIKFAEENNLLNKGTKAFGEILDDDDIEKDENCRYVAGLTLPKNITVKSSGLFEVKIIAGGKYAVFQYRGDRQLIESFYENIFAYWIAKEEFEIADRPLMEFYLNDEADTPTEDLLTDIYVPIL